MRSCRRRSGRSVGNAHWRQGKRGKKYDRITVWTFNGSSWGAIKEKFEEKVEGVLQCYAVQEHHLLPDKWAVVTQSNYASFRVSAGQCDGGSD